MASATRAPSKKAVPVQADDEAGALSLQRVVEIQRVRMLRAMVEITAERGASNVTVAHVVARSAVSRRTFYEVFKDCEDCLLAALDDAIEQACRTVVGAYRSKQEWHAQIRTALTALLELFEEQPDTARFLVVDSLRAGSQALQRRNGVLAHAIAAVDEGRYRAKGRYKPSVLTAEGVVGGALSVLHARLLDADRDSLIELVNPLMGMIVLPYLGSDVASRELERAQPQRNGAVKRQVRDPLRSVGTRLTYRTVRVLLSVAAQPGRSNRDIGIASGISDQGQISKLLGRLERLELVHNVRIAPSRGSPNAWMLTRKGEHVAQALSAEAPEDGEHRRLEVA